jgi:hypothetical protein
VVATDTLHGSPHDHNVIAERSTEPLFLDFETTCIGPIEWDLAHQRDAVAREYPVAIDEPLLDACRFATSFKTAAFCWADADRGDLYEHAAHHTSRLRRHLQERGL